MKLIDIKSIEEARKAISSYAVRTPLEVSAGATQRAGFEIFLKMEQRQRTGSFKIRGAANKLLHLSDEEKKRGVVAFSAGNHAQGVASMAQKLGMKAVIVMPQATPLVKVSNTRGYGAEVHLVGSSIEECHEYLVELHKKFNYTIIHPYEDPLIIAGQGTIGLEILEEVPDIDMVVVPIGGGGLISGISIAVKSKNPKVRVVGVQSQALNGMATLFQTKGTSGTGVKKAISTIADGIAVKQPSRLMYDQYISKFVDEVVTVSEDEIAEAMLFLLEKEKVVVEGAGAVGLAAVFNSKLSQKPQRALVVLSGGNVDSNLIEKIVERGLQRTGRLVTLNVRVPDVPGSLTKLTGVIAEKRANIIQIIHSRVSEKLALGETLIELTLETTGFEHIEGIKEGLGKVGVMFMD